MRENNVGIRVHLLHVTEPEDYHSRAVTMDIASNLILAIRQRSDVTEHRLGIDPVYDSSSHCCEHLQRGRNTNANARTDWGAQSNIRSLWASFPTKVIFGIKRDAGVEQRFVQNKFVLKTKGATVGGS